MVLGRVYDGLAPDRGLLGRFRRFGEPVGCAQHATGVHKVDIARLGYLGIRRSESLPVLADLLNLGADLGCLLGKLALHELLALPQQRVIELAGLARAHGLARRVGFGQCELVRADATGCHGGKLALGRCAQFAADLVQRLACLGKVPPLGRHETGAGLVVQCFGDGGFHLVAAGHEVAVLLDHAGVGALGDHFLDGAAGDHGTHQFLAAGVANDLRHGV